VLELCWYPFVVGTVLVNMPNIGIRRWLDEVLEAISIINLI